MMDMMGMLGKVKEFQAKMKDAQEEVAKLTEIGEAGGGMVKVKIDGNKKLLSIEIDPDLMRPDDREMLQDLIVAATNKAIDAIDIKVKENLQNATKGMVPPNMPNIPGFDLGKMFS